MPNLQPILEDARVKLRPLRADDFETLYAVAKDPLIWEQHPSRDRWKREVFETFFEGAMESGGAFVILDKATGEVIGSTRFYEKEAAKSSFAIGYTFYARAYWGTGINSAVKSLMLDYAFGFVDAVCFHVGAGNRRSQIAVERLGAVKESEAEIAYHGEQSNLNYCYSLHKSAWQSSHPA